MANGNSMPIIITSDPPLPYLPRPPVGVSLKTLQQMAREAGNPNFNRQDIVGVTVPRIKVDQRGLNYQTVQNRRGKFFRYDKGNLQITISNNIFLIWALSMCEWKIWAKHERDHVADNENLGGPMMQSFQADSYMKWLFEAREWTPLNNFQIIQDSTQQTCYRIFNELTSKAVIKRDNPAEYKRIRKLIKDKCGGTHKPARHRSIAHDRKLQSK